MFEVINLKKTYKNENGNFVGLNNISFKLGDKGIVFLFGGSGEGKSTLLNIMSGLDTYDAGGRVVFNGKDIMKMSQKERDYYRSHEIGIIFEKNNLLDDLTVEENVKLARQIGGKQVTEAQVENALATVKLKGFAKRKISELSSGEVQRVAIARVLLLNPKVVFLDEPTGNLDRENAKIFWDAIKEVSKKSLIVAISHRDEVVNEYADRVLTIKAGQIISDEYKNRKLKAEDNEVFENKPKAKKGVEKTGILPFKTNLKIGAKALVANKFKFVAMLVLIALTLVSFATSYLLATFNPNLVKTKTISSGGYDYVVFEKADGSLVTSQDIAKVVDKDSETKFSIIYSANDEIPYTALSTSYQISGFIEAWQNANSVVNNLGQRVLYGAYPAANVEDVEIAISDYLAKSLSKNGASVKVVVSGEETSEYCKDWDIKKFASTTDRVVKISIGGVYYAVAAIYETNYSKLVGENLNVIAGREKDFEYNLENVYSLIHIGNGKLNKLIENETSISAKLTFRMGDNEIYVKNQSVVGFSSLDAGVLKYSTKSTLGGSEILLPLSLFNSLFSANIGSEFFTASASDQAAAFTAATAGTDKSVLILSAGDVVKKYNVIGITNGTEVVFADNKTNSAGDLVITDRIGEIVKLNNFPIFKIATDFTNANAFLNVITNLTESGFEYLSQYTASINSATDFIARLSVIFATVTVFCLVFSVFCMITFFSDIIRGRKRSIGALRSLGAKSGNVFLIFFMSCLILMLSSLVLGGILSVATDLVLNVKLMETFGIGVTLFHMNGAAFGLMLATGCVVVVVGSLIPIAIYCIKTPIDVIKR